MMRCWWIFVSAFFVVGGFAYLLDGPRMAAEYLALAGVSAVGTLAAIRFLMVPRIAKRQWRENHNIREELTLTLNQDGFTIAEPSSHVDARWDQMLKWEESDAILAIFPNSLVAYILPKQQVGPEHIDFARQRLISNGLAQAGAVRR